jgi:hypothetical protein
MLSVTVVLAVLWMAPFAANPYTIAPGGAIGLRSSTDGLGELIADVTPGLLSIYVE